MFEKSRKKIVLSIMAVLALLLALTLAGIYVSNYYVQLSKDREMLRRYAQLYPLEPTPGVWQENPRSGEFWDWGKPPAAESTRDFWLSHFYALRLSGDGQVESVDSQGPAVHNSSQLEAYAQEIYVRGRREGEVDGLLYYMEEKEGYTLVAFMDHSQALGNMFGLLRQMLLIGGGAMAALYFVALYLARRIVEPLEESHRRQRQFVSDAGHELKTPLTAIHVNGDCLEREIGVNPWLENIRYESKRMSELVGQLLELARGEQAAMPMEELDFSHLLTGEVLPMESVAMERGLELRSQIEEGLMVWGHGGQLRQLASILLDNAIEHIEGGRVIELVLEREQVFAKLSVSNPAPRMDREECKLLFERFYRRDVSRSGGDGHYGLGLSIAKAISQAHKARLEAVWREGRVICTLRLPLVRQGKRRQ